MKWAVFNQKGGVGKTSITCNLAAAMAKMGRKVLVVDLDAQCNASQYLLGDGLEQVGNTIGDFFDSTLSFKLFKNSLQDAIYPTTFDGLYVVPADTCLKELQPKLEGRYKIFKLAEAVDAAIASQGFQEVFFDTPPALNFYSMSSLMAADRVLIPFDCDAFSQEAILSVMDIIDEVSSDHRPELDVAGIIINQFQSSAKLPRQSIETLINQALPVLEPYLTSSVVMRESHQAKVALPYFRSGHRLTQQFMQLADNLVKMYENKANKKKTTSKSSKKARSRPESSK